MHPRCAKNELGVASDKSVVRPSGPDLSAASPQYLCIASGGESVGILPVIGKPCDDITQSPTIGVPFVCI